MGVGFKNTCTVLGKWNISKVVPGLFGWIYKTNKIVRSAFSLQVTSVDAQPGKLRSNPRRKQFLSLLFPMENKVLFV